MKKATFFILFFTLIHSSFARPVFHNFSKITRHDTASFANRDIRQILAEIMNVIGLQPNVEIKEAKVSNIEAAVSHKKRFILYNPEFISWINIATKSKWAVPALLAHEMGHHLNGHTLKKGGSTPQLELEADQFAGYVLYKLGATVEEAQEVMKYIAKPEISATHPARASRMLAIQQGWNKAANAELIITAAKNVPATYFKKEITN